MGGSSFQMQQGLQRAASMARLNQLQQQQYGVAGVASGAMRQQQQAGIYSGQMNFGGAQQQQQQNQQQQQMARSAALIGQTGHLPMLSGQSAAAAAAHLNLQAQLLSV